MRVIDSHTEGEPTRVVVDGLPDLGRGSMAERRKIFAERFDHVRSFAVNEPRGNDAVVGALLCQPVDPTNAAGVIFFNNVGVIGMCGHGTIGLAVTLAHMGRIEPGAHRFETPVGNVTVDLLGPNEVEIENVPSYRYRKDVAIDVAEVGTVVGDIAWGGNWFFLVSSAPRALTMAEIPALTRLCAAIMRALELAGIKGEDGGKIDHVELFGAPSDPAAHSRNFVLCPGGAYDRSPCGTGTSAKLACLAADGKLAPDSEWVQESIVGSRFRARYRPGTQGRIVPRIRGCAYVVAEATLLRDPRDPFADGMRGAPIPSK
jgi:4-hydroxyproline epimerase